MEFRVIRRLAAFVAVVVLAGCASAPASRTAAASSNPLASFIEQQISTPPFGHAIWGVLIVEEDGTVVYERNAHTLLMPGSNRKMYSATTAMNCTPPDTRIMTTLVRSGDDLVLRGDGDPSLGAARYGREDDMLRFARAVRARGIVSIRNVIADVSRFDRVTLPPSWKLGNLLRPYSAPVDALAWRENDIDDTAPIDPAITAAIALRDALVAEGIEVRGSVEKSAGRVEGETIATTESPYLFELVANVLKNSNNLYAETLFKRIAPEPSSYDAALSLERRFLVDEARLDPYEFDFADGCGLSPEDMAAPASAVSILRWMHQPDRAGFWWQLLATPGEEGTLGRRLPGLEQRFRGKTGTINGVNALSGILVGTSGRIRYVSVVVNHHTGQSPAAVAIIDSIVQQSANF